jgi:hypothetical protein
VPDEGLKELVDRWAARVLEAVQIAFKERHALDFTGFLKTVQVEKKKSEKVMEKVETKSSKKPRKVKRIEQICDEALASHVDLFYKAAFGRKAPRKRNRTPEDTFEFLRTACIKLSGTKPVEEERFKKALNTFSTFKTALQSADTSSSSSSSSTSDHKSIAEVWREAAEQLEVGAQSSTPPEGPLDTLDTAQLVYSVGTRTLAAVSGNQSAPVTMSEDLDVNLVHEIAEKSGEPSGEPSGDKVVLVQAAFSRKSLIMNMVVQLANLKTLTPASLKTYTAKQLLTLAQKATQSGAWYVLNFAAAGRLHASASELERLRYFLKHNHATNFKNVSQAVFRLRVSAEAFYGTNVSTLMSAVDRRNLIRDWNTSTRVSRQRTPYAFYATHNMPTTAAVILLDKNGDKLDLRGQESSRKVQAHGLRMVSSINPDQNLMRSMKPMRARVATVRIKPINVHVPAGQDVKLSSFRVLVAEKSDDHYAERNSRGLPRSFFPERPDDVVEDYGKFTKEIAIHVTLRYPQKPDCNEDRTAPAPAKGAPDPSGRATSAPEAPAANLLRRLGKDEPFGLWKNTLSEIKHPNLEVLYQDLANDPEAKKQMEAAQAEVFPEGWAEKYHNPAFADVGLKRFMSIYAPFEQRLYHVGVGTGAFAFNTVEKGRRKAQRERKGSSKHYWKKVKKIVNQMHKGVADFILAAFDFFALPKPLKGNGLGKRNRWILQHLAFGRFEALLKRRAERRGGFTTLLLRVNEAGSTMGCGNCGNPNLRVGNSDVHICKCCGHKQSRDGGAARNIGMLVSVGEPPPSLPPKCQSRKRPTTTPPPPPTTTTTSKKQKTGVQEKAPPKKSSPSSTDDLMTTTTTSKKQKTGEPTRMQPNRARKRKRSLSSTDLMTTPNNDVGGADAHSKYHFVKDER